MVKASKQRLWLHPIPSTCSSCHNLREVALWGRKCSPKSAVLSELLEIDGLSPSRLPELYIHVPTYHTSVGLLKRLASRT